MKQVNGMDNVDDVVVKISYEEQSLLDSKTYVLQTPVNLTWKDVSYDVQIKEGPLWNRKITNKKLLDRVSGSVRPGQFLAIMGSSGAGKSTLLDVLAGRKNTGTLTGSILVNGNSPVTDPLCKTWFKRISAYVTQDDCLMGTLTVRETLQFYADLKLPSKLPKEKKRERVQDVIQELRLENVADSYIGTQFKRGISGGEKKRVSIGCELVENPGLIFLDEPTTGLDAYNALIVMERLREIAKKGRTVICTIHQPRSSVFEMIDQLLLLSQGHVVYFGPAKEAIAHFSSLGFQCPQFANAADYLIDVTVENLQVRDNPETAKVMHLLEPASKHEEVSVIDGWAVSQRAESVTLGIEEITKYSTVNLNDQPPLSQYAANWFIQTFALSKRCLTNLLRNPIATYSSFGQSIIMALLIGSIYWQMGTSQASIQDRLGVLFFMMMNSAFSNMFHLNQLMAERNLINREREGNAYCTSAYFTAKTLIDTPFSLIPPFLFAAISYWMVGLYAGIVQFSIFVACLLLFTVVASGFFMAIGALSPSIDVAQIIAPVILVFLVLFGGFYLNSSSIPVYYIWVKYLSFIRYAFQIVTKNEFDAINQFTCSDNSPCITTCPTSPGQPGVPCIQNGYQELVILDMENVKLWEQFTALAIYAVVTRILAYIFLRFLHKEKR